MNKLKLFIDNFLVYGLGGVISKLVPLIMVPIVTRIMPTTDYYGISDLSNTVVQFASAIAVKSLSDSSPVTTIVESSVNAAITALQFSFVTK